MSYSHGELVQLAEEGRRKKMPRYIDADKLLARYKERCAGCKETKNYCEHCCDLADVISDIEDAPSAQPEITEAQVKEYCEKRWLVVLTFDAFQRLKSAQPERNKGKWKVCGTFGDFLKCSCCGYKKPWNEDVFIFCPNCGAEMEKPNEKTIL